MPQSQKGSENPMYGKFGDKHPSFKPLTSSEVKYISMFPDWKVVNPFTISNRLRGLGVVIGGSRIKRLQDSYR